MRFKIRLLWLTIGLMHFTMPVTLWAQQPVYYNLGVDDGLPGSTAYYVLTDQKGYIWVGTEFGVSKYNGRNFINYTKKDGLGDNVVFCLAEDNQGRIFAGCQNGTISFFDGTKFKPITGSDSLAHRINQLGGIINTLEFDENNDLWVGTSRTLYKLKSKTGFSVVEVINDYDPKVLCAIKQFKKGNNVESQYFNTHHKQNPIGDSILVYAQVITTELKKSDLLPLKFSKKEASNPRMVSLTTKKEEIYFSYQNKLFTYSKSGFNKIKEFSKTILFLFEDTEQNLLISVANEGVFLFEKGDLTQNPTTLFEGNSIGSIHEDFQNGIWFSSINNGIYIVPYIQNKLYSNDGIISALVYKNHLLAINNKGQLIDLSKAGNPTDGMPRLYEKNTITKAGFFKHENKLIVFGAGVIAYDVDNGTHQSLTFSNYQMYATGVAANENGELYATTLNEICVLKDDKWNLINSLPAKGSCLWYNQQDSSFWVGTRSGLYIWKNNVFKKHEQKELSSEHIVCIVPGIRNEVYVGTKNSGLFIFKNGNWKNLNTSNGLASDYCNQIYVDSLQRVWISTNKGISFFYEKSPEIIRNINRKNGLITDEITGVTVIGNHLFVTSSNGIVRMDIDGITNSSKLPRVYISKILVSGHDAGRKKVFSWDQNEFRFYIDCINYKNQGTNGYSYQLIGFDDTPKISQSEYLEYSNLPYGKYLLKVQALNSKNEPIGKIQTLSFEILPPFWVKTWFILVCILFTVLLLYGLFKWRISIIQKKESEKRKLDKLIAESQIAAIRAQMNPHFIFNAINSIQDFILHNKTQEAYDYLAKFAKLIRMVLNHSKLDLISIEQEIQWLKLYIELEQLRFKNCFQFEMNLGNLTEEDMGIKIPNMVIQPFIENSIWHGFMPLKGSRNGILKLTFQIDKNHLNITIEDNGVGRKKEIKQTDQESHGTMLIKDKLTMINLMNQTKSNYVVYDLQEDGKPTGTKIILTLELENEN